VGGCWRKIVMPANLPSFLSQFHLSLKLIVRSDTGRTLTLAPCHVQRPCLGQWPCWAAPGLAPAATAGRPEWRRTRAICRPHGSQESTNRERPSSRRSTQRHLPQSGPLLLIAPLRQFRQLAPYFSLI
jgi:hypothetical protein